jgi:TonB family protein
VTAALVVSPLLTARSSASNNDYTGEPITLTLVEADLGDVLETFAALTDLEILLEPGITGTVTLDVTSKPWDQVLDEMLTAQGLAWSHEDGRLIVRREGAPTVVSLEPKAEATPFLAGQIDGDPIFRVKDGVTPPLKIAGAPPTYPEDCRQEKVMGVVIAEAVIEASGRVVDVTILRSPDNRLSEAALDAIRDWVFEPATLEGEPVAVRYALTVKFHLE